MSCKVDADAELKAALQDADAWYDEALAALPRDHTWRDVDQLAVERCRRAGAAREAHKLAEAEFQRLIDEEERETVNRALMTLRPPPR